MKKQILRWTASLARCSGSTRTASARAEQSPNTSPHREQTKQGIDMKTVYWHSKILRGTTFLAFLEASARRKAGPQA
jgi:hypothetical protein